MKSLMSLFQEVLADAGTRCCTCTDFDLKTAEARFAHEGLSFLTITLPSFGKDFQKSLSEGMVARHLFSGFQRKGGLPRFLGGFLELVFERETGVLLDDPSIDAIFCVRQLTLMFQKVLLPTSDRRLRDAMDKYVQCEQDVREADASADVDLMADFDRVSGLLWSNVLSSLNREIQDGQIVPGHGPGATADKLYGNAKYNQSVWTERLEQLFPFGEMLAPTWKFFEELQHVNILEPGAEIPVKVIAVPKTLKTPRIIAIEPTCMQYVQQGISRSLVRKLEQDDFCSPFIGFTDQVPNRELARQGSLLGDLATLDLSEASDRVSNQHVRLLMRRFPAVAAGIDACRSRKADVLGHGVLRLSKFASMGSALTFPLEAMVFVTLVFVGIERELNTRMSLKKISSFKGRVRVYGDDIIVPVEFVRSVVSTLEAFGFKVGRDKSFWTGKFRESCGGDYYDGVDVTVVRCRRELPTRRGQAQEIVSLISLRNQLYKAGFWRVVRALDQHLEALVPFPAVLDTSPVHGKLSFLGYQVDRVGSRYQTSLVRGVKVSAPSPRDELSGYGALMKWFLLRGVEPLQEGHLERAGRPRSVNIKIGMGQPF
jgi:hypothetical protein